LARSARASSVADAAANVRGEPRRVAHGEGHLGLCDDAAGTSQLLVGAEAARRAPEELAGARMLAELRHGDAAKGKRRRVVAQADALEGAECVADDEGARGGGDQGVHRDRLLRGAWPSRWSAVSLRSTS
jgi:hypothetical protein